MTTLHHQVRIAAPVDVVWRTLANLESIQRYNPSVASVRLLTDQREGIGAVRRCELKPKGWVEERVWHWAPPHAIGLEVAASEWPLAFMKWRTELQADGNATIVRQEMNYQLKYGPLGQLMDALMMRRKFDRILGEIFENLKRFVEQARV